MQLSNETAIITGSTTGIGKTLAKMLLSEGCKVAICSRNEENLKKALMELKAQYKDSIIGFTCDVSKPNDLEKLVKKVISSFGSIRILIANAGVNSKYGPFSCLSTDMVESNAKTVIGINLIGVMNSIAAVLPQMQKQHYGRIVTLSGAGVERPIDNMTIYSASKGGVVTFSKCLAYELAQSEKDIKINIFQPGMLKTNLTTNVSCVPNWQSEKEVKKNVEFVLEYFGGDIEKRCKKVLPYLKPKCKLNGKEFRGFSIFKLILNAMKMQRAMKKIAKKAKKE